ncbi:MAG: hypothetical protein ABR499_00340 [Gemmatimonadaceae bacterium]
MRRRLISLIDQIPGPLFVAGAVVVLGLFQGVRLFAQLRRNPGAMELSRILFTAGFVVLVIFAVRRRQTDVWVTAAQVLAAIVGSNLLGVVLVWPFLPSGLPVSLASTAWTGLANGVAGAFLGLPLGAAGLWLSRRWGTESGVTERRARAGSTRAVRAEAQLAAEQSPVVEQSPTAISELDVTRDNPEESGR